MLLFAPWFAILGWLYWSYPKSLPATPARRRFDVMSLSIAFALSFLAMRWAYAFASDDIQAGPIWKQVLASLLAYKAFLLVLGLAYWQRGRRFGAAAQTA
jgi:hypothetical protein